ncbi:hypothetical protein A2U01_0098787, partial [Trifolium medium]|nr:hypothetical protein [Trifolium medium]
PVEAMKTYPRGICVEVPRLYLRTTSYVYD